MDIEKETILGTKVRLRILHSEIGEEIVPRGSGCAFAGAAGSTRCRTSTGGGVAADVASDRSGSGGLVQTQSADCAGSGGLRLGLIGDTRRRDARTETLQGARG